MARKPSLSKIPKKIHGRVVDALHILERTQDAAREHAAAKRELSTLTRDFAFNDGEPIGGAVAGDFLLTFAFGPKTTYEVPEDVKVSYKKTEPLGRFTPNFVRA